MVVGIKELLQDQTRSIEDQAVELSVIVPISERHGNLRDIFLQHVKNIEACTDSYEWIFVLDGPHPDIIKSLKALKGEYQNIQILLLNRWVGEATALAVGFERAQAPVILTIPSYFQVEPTEIEMLLHKLTKDDFDLVISWRFPRIDSFFNRIQSGVFHWFTQMLTGVKYHDLGCGLRAMKRRVIEEIQLYGDLHRFLPLLAHQRGFKVAEAQVKQSSFDTKPRFYSIGTYVRRLIDILSLFFLLRFTKKPLRFFGLVGSSLLGSGAVITTYLGLYRLLGFGGIADRPLLLLGVLLMVLGVQLFSIGLLGELIIFTHAREHQEYQIEEILG